MIRIITKGVTHIKHHQPLLFMSCNLLDITAKDEPLTVTDVNLILGRILPDNMPDSFGDSGTHKLDIEFAERKFRKLTETILAFGDK
jgi:hypothetical protein|tara:strand:- start:360 stop:620 length:261 start_codon:yes stop_codon:yes gene_type:complete